MTNFVTQINSTVEALLEISRSNLIEKVENAAEICAHALKNNLPMLICGNGGSAADAQHISGELVGSFLKPRRALNVRALTVDTSVITAWANDCSYDTIFSRQVEGYGVSGGILFALSTSGNSKNIIQASIYAKSIGMLVIALTGKEGGQLAGLADILLNVPSNETPRVQELHMCIYHYICELIEIKIIGD